jgi:nucleoside-diphosphate-sugar epimerase
MRKILITGSSGFIGDHVTNVYIENNFLVYGVDIKNSKKKSNFFFYKCNILNKEKLLAYFKIVKPEIVIHLAARTDLNGRKITDYKMNYKGTENIIKICNIVKSVKRVVFASTLLVNKFPYKTSNVLYYNPDTIYGKSKVLMEKVIRLTNLRFEWCIIRPTTIWGDFLQNHFKFFIRLIKNKLYFHIGPKKIYKSYGYVKNTSYQIYKLTLAKKIFFNKKTYYLHDYIPICLNEFADKISIIYNKRKNWTVPMFLAKFVAIIGDLIIKLGFVSFPFQSRRFKNINASFIIDSQRLKKVCGPLPFNPEQSLHSFLDSYKNIEIN